MGKISISTLLTKKRLKILLPILVVLLLICSVSAIIKVMNGPAEGTIAQAPSKPDYKLPKKSLMSGRYDGKYVSFSYPEHFDITKAPKNTGLLESVSLYSNDHSSKQVSIGIVRESLGNDSGANYRLAHPEIYKKQYDEFKNLVFTKDQNGSEYTGFIVHNDMVASVSLSATYTKNLSADYKEFLKNWQWK